MAVAGACSGDALPAVIVPEKPPQPVGVRSGSAAPRRTAFVELFAGRAMLSEAVQEAGGFVVILPCDLYTTDGADLRDQAVLARVVDRLEKDVFWVHLAPPCRTYSQARRRAKVLRTAAHPEGHGDDPDLAEANELAKITFAFAEPLFSVENPLSPLIWRLPAAERVARMRGVRMLEFEQCAYGGQHRKATGVLTNASWLPGLRCKNSPEHTPSPCAAASGATRTSRRSGTPRRLRSTRGRCVLPGQPQPAWPPPAARCRQHWCQPA